MNKETYFKLYTILVNAIANCEDPRSQNILDNELQDLKRSLKYQSK